MNKTGITDWLVQRVSALVLAVYTIGLVGWMLLTPALTYSAWQALFATGWMQVATLVALLATCAHAWVGLWTVGTDYLSGGFRLVYQAVSILILIAYVLWGVKILWGLL